MSKPASFVSRRWKGRLPADRFVPIVKEYLDKYETFGCWKDLEGVSGQATFPGVQYEAPSPTMILSEEIGMSYDWMLRFSKGQTKTIDFDVADRLLCAMNLPHLWWSDLADLYYEVQLEALDSIEQEQPIDYVCRLGHHTKIRPGGVKRCAACGNERKRAYRRRVRQEQHQAAAA